MFISEKQSNQNAVTSLMRKKHLFQVKIRQQEKSRIINQLREVALMPEDIIMSLNSLPHSIQQVIHLLIDSKNWSQAWHKTVSERLLTFLNSQITKINLESIAPTKLVLIMSYVMIYTEIQQQDFENLWLYFKQLSRNWKANQKQVLLRLVTKALSKYQDKKYFSYGKEILKNQNKRFTLQVLQFYNFLIKNYTSDAFSENFLNDHLCWRLVQSLGFVFYSVEQKLKMCEILIQVLYQSEHQQVSKNWNLSALFQALQFLISFTNDHKLLTERCLYLIYNINIDAGSKIFLIHTCAQVIINEMKNNDLPFKLRELMAETYLSAVFNLQPIYQPKYLKNHSSTFFSSLLFILQQFGQNKFLVQSLKQLLENLLKLEGLVSNFEFKKMIINKGQLLDAIKRVQFGLEFIQEWQLQ